MSKIRELRERRARIVADAQRLLPAKGSMSAEDKARFDLMMGEADILKDEIDAEERRAEASMHDNDIHRTRRPPEAQIGNGFEEARASGDDRRFRRAFNNWLRHGLNTDDRGNKGLDDEDRAIMLSRKVEHRDMGVGTGNLGGYFVPQGFVYDVDVAMKFVSELFANSNMLDTSTGNPLPHPTSNDTMNAGALIGEGQQVSEQDVAVGQILFGAYKFTSNLVRVSLELAQDSAFDMESFLKQQFAIRLARGLNPFLTVGTGSANNQPMGLMTAATNSGITVVGDDNATTPNPSTQIGYTDLLSLEHSVDPLYRPGAKWMMHDSTLRQLKGLRDKYGRPLWVPGVATNAPDTILGYRYILNNDMSPIASGNKSLAFGAISQKFTIRRVKDLAVLRLVERYADFGQLGFLAFSRFDSQLLDAGTHPVMYLQNP